MTNSADSEKLLAHADALGLDLAKDATVRLSHMGRLIADSVLQRRQKYTATVQPRVERFERERPEAATTAGFLEFARDGDLSQALNWRGTGRLALMTEIAQALDDLGIESVEGLRDAFASDVTSDATSARLRGIKGVGRKTVNYLKILAGLDFCAIDTRIKNFAAGAGIEDLCASHLEDVIADAAAARNTTVRSIDAAVWAYGQKP